MAEDLQGLLNKIHTDGIQKAEEEKAAIIADAKKEAAKIIADAKAQAEMAKAYRQNPSSDAGIELLLPQKEQGEVESVLKSALLTDLKANPKINLTNEFGAGLQISFADNEVFFDFSDEALADILCKFVGPKLAAVIKG